VVTVLTRQGASPQTGALSHRYPYFLPNGRDFLYTHLGALDSSGIYIASLDNPNQAVRLLRSDAKAVYAPPRNGLPGYLLWLRDQSVRSLRLRRSASACHRPRIRSTWNRATRTNRCRFRSPAIRGM
jgi:hypothetical protein